MELKYLKTIKAILEEGSFQRAANKLNYTQSTITFQVRQTERELKVKLFEKIGRSMRFTQAGRDLLPMINTILEAAREMEAYSQKREPFCGTLTVAMPETLLVYKMQPVIRAFHDAAPQVQLSLQALNCYEIRHRVQQGNIDLGVHYDVGGESDTVRTEPLFTFPLTLVASPSLIEPSCDSFLSALPSKQISLIYSDRDSVYQQIFDEYLKSKDIVAENTMELSSTEAIKQCVASGLGVAYLPKFAVEKELLEKRLVPISTELNRQTVSAVYSYHKNRWMSPAMKLFIRMINEKL